MFFAGWRTSDLAPDFVAGLTLAAIAIPEQMATARLGGFPPQMGFVAFIVATIGFVVLGVALYFAAQAGKQLQGSRVAFVWSKFPKFVLGFLVISALASAGAFNPKHVASLANLSRCAFLLTFAGVGLKTNFAELRKQGLRPLLVGAIGEVVIAGATLAMVVGADALFHL